MTSDEFGNNIVQDWSNENSTYTMNDSDSGLGGSIKESDIDQLESIVTFVVPVSTSYVTRHTSCIRQIKTKNPLLSNIRGAMSHDCKRFHVIPTFYRLLSR